MLAIEPGDELFGSRARKWVVSCKFKGTPDRAVGVGEVEDVRDTCAHHSADGFLLVCTSYPSSGLVSRLEGIDADRASGIRTAYWDGVTLERLLATPRGWAIAQRFLPKSTEGWQVWGTELPNRYVAACKGHLFHLTNRIGTIPDASLATVQEGLERLEARSEDLPQGHLLRLRGLFWDDKNGAYVWYIDYLQPDDEDTARNESALLASLWHEEVLDDGQFHSIDLRLVTYLRYSDHHDQDHYDYYEPYVEVMAAGGSRSSARRRWQPRSDAASPF